MRAKTLSTLFPLLRAVLAILATALLLTSAWADHQTVLHSFGNGSDGMGPIGGLLMDAAGNLYGVTYGGGIYQCYGGGCGTVFELSRVPGGRWTETVLYNFANTNDGGGPDAGLIMDAAGNLYGVTAYGGLNGDLGTVFELSPGAGGTWTETVLYSFSGNDGRDPAGSLIMDAAGNLYGLTDDGGAYGEGIAFELSPSGGGGWTETVLHSFGNGSDAAYPAGSLIMDAAGNLYGATMQGGSYCPGYGCGTVFELSPAQGGGWTETVLYSFNGSDGFQPRAGLVMDATGNLYGTTVQGGPYCFFGCGTVFELSPSVGGGWTEMTLYNFQNPPDAEGPDTVLILDSAGNLYGTASLAGNYGYGAVFEVSPRQGSWTETQLYSFGRDADGGGSGGVIMDRFGDLYGEGGGGIYYGGTAYELTPPATRPAPSTQSPENESPRVPR